jgi:hypothetical protein
MLTLDVCYPVIVPLGFIITNRSDVEESNVVTKAHPEATIILVSFYFKLFLNVIPAFLLKLLSSRIYSFLNILDRIWVLFPFI